MINPTGRDAERCDAVVIGAGPAGSVAALRLAQAGWRVAILERSSFPRRKVCGEYLSGTNWRLLRRLGVGEEFAASAGPSIKRVAIFGRERRSGVHKALTAPLPRAAGDRSAADHRSDAQPVETASLHEEWGRAFTRDRLDAMLLGRAKQQGAVVVQPARCTAVERRHGKWCCVAQPERGGPVAFEAPVVVAAHGAWLRGSLPTLPPTPPASAKDLLGFKAHFAGAKLEADLMPLLSFPGGYGGMVTCQDQLVSLSCCIRRGVLDCLRKSDPAPAGEVVLKHIKQSAPAVARALDGASLLGDWLAAGPIRPGRRRLYHDGLFAIGNAGGECHSVVAEGISMAMQSAWIAADTLLEANNAKPVAALAQIDHAGCQYRRRWSRGFNERLRVSSLVARWAMNPRLVDASQPLLHACPSILTVAARLAGKSRITCLKEAP